MRSLPSTPTSSPLADQLASIFKAGLDADPNATGSLRDALGGLPDGEPTSDSPVTKTEAHYRPADGKDHCSDCAHFETSGRCEIVVGTIRPEDVCDHYKPAGGTQTDE